MRIEVSEGLSLAEGAIRAPLIHASGPGGQTTNKAATAVQLRFDARRSPLLPNAVKACLQALAGHRLTQGSCPAPASQPVIPHI